MTAVGVLLSRLNAERWGEAVTLAEGLGFQSVWMGEHLVLPVEVRGELVAGTPHPDLPPTTPVWDVGASLGWLAAQTTSIRLGTFVYLLGMRHPFLSARTFATVDRLSGGRVDVGVGAGWLESEFDAVGLDFGRRGRHLDEAITVCRRLWTEPVIEHHGPSFDFGPVGFEPKPVQLPLPLHVGGESEAAMRRAARLAEGWLGMVHTPTTARSCIAHIRRYSDEVGRTAPPVRIGVVGVVDAEQPLAAWEDAGVDTVIVAPWERSRDATAGLRRFAEEHLR
jgi:probable F420-dependent oxidoreductase